MNIAKKRTKLPERGADQAEEVYQLVGIALSWWESSEDIILGLFRNLCGDCEPVAVESFIRAPRNVRISMLLFAMETYAGILEGDEIATVQKALRELDKLASTRNEIAHGHVSKQTVMVGDVTIASGNYLLPSLNEGQMHERSFRFYHTPATIDAFITNLREWRGNIMDVSLAVMMRIQGRKNFGGDALPFMQLIHRISRLEVYGYDAVDDLKAMLTYVEHWRAGNSVYESPSPLEGEDTKA